MPPAVASAEAPLAYCPDDDDVGSDALSFSDPDDDDHGDGDAAAADPFDAADDDYAGDYI